MLTAGSSVCVSAAEIFSDINDVPWGGAQAYINSVYENGLMVGDVDENGKRVFRAKENISYNELVQLVYNLSEDTADNDTINKWAEEMRKNNIPKWAYNSVSYAFGKRHNNTYKHIVIYEHGREAQEAPQGKIPHIFLEDFWKTKE